MTESQTAFELLLDIDRRCRLLAADLPSQETRSHSWSGIGFRLGGHWYVAPMGEVAEVLHEPRCTLMPGVKPWVKGFYANPKNVHLAQWLWIDRDGKAENRPAGAPREYPPPGRIGKPAGTGEQPQ